MLIEIFSTLIFLAIAFALNKTVLQVYFRLKRLQKGRTEAFPIHFVPVNGFPRLMRNGVSKFKHFGHYWKSKINEAPKTKALLTTFGDSAFISLMSPDLIQDFLINYESEHYSKI